VYLRKIHSCFYIYLELNLINSLNWSSSYYLNPDASPGTYSNSQTNNVPNQSIIDLGHRRTELATKEGGGSEWEPIKILLDGDSNSNKMNTAIQNTFPTQLPKLAKTT
jgi:hypothetical protein